MRVFLIPLPSRERGGKCRDRSLDLSEELLLRRKEAVRSVQKEAV